MLFFIKGTISKVEKFIKTIKVCNARIQKTAQLIAMASNISNVKYY